MSLQKRVQTVLLGSNLYHNWKDTIHGNQNSLINILWFTFIMNATIGKVPLSALVAWLMSLSPCKY